MSATRLRHGGARKGARSHEGVGVLFDAGTAEAP